MSSFLYLPTENNSLVEAVVRRSPLERAGDADLTIDARDEMFADALEKNRGDRDGAVVSYFASGLEVAGSILQILDDLFPESAPGDIGAREGSAARDQEGAPDDLAAEDVAAGDVASGDLVRVLDFGCGYGRATRFLAAQLGASRGGPPPRAELWASDILVEALDFQRARFGVVTFPSARSPTDLESPRRFDLIYVGSLFTHLPERTFYPWLECLAGQLSERGVLAFTVHDRELLPPHHRMPEGGLFFEASSESRTLDPLDYGSAWVTADFVDRQISRLRAPAGGESAEECGAARRRRIARGLCNYQDLYLVSATSGPDLDRLRFDGGAEVRIERCERGGPGDLVLSGWAISRFPGFAVEQIVVELDDQTIGTACPELARPDCYERLFDLGLSEAQITAAGLDRDRLLHSGWQCQCRLPVPHSGRSRLVVSARSGRVTKIVFAGSLDRAVFLAAEENFRRRYDRSYQLEEKIARMKKSRFWALRSRWFALKRALGLTDET